MTARFLALWLVPAALAPDVLWSAGPEFVVHKTPGCGCCSLWEEHLRGAGFRVISKTAKDLSGVKRKAGVPRDLQSCHTGLVNGYFIEGHVPASSIKKLLAGKPGSLKGLAVPGMPVGSPGMEGGHVEKYEVFSVGKDGKKSVFDSF